MLSSMEGISFQTDSDLTSLSAVVDESLQHSRDWTHTNETLTSPIIAGRTEVEQETLILVF